MNEVEAVKSEFQIQVISHLLLKHHSKQMSDIWNLGINLALRVSDLLSIKISDVEGGRLILRESKTGNIANINLNSKALEIISNIKSEHPNAVYLFESRSSRNRTNKDPKPLSRQAVSHAFKAVGEIEGLKLSTHSMRKTRGYHLYKKTNNIGSVMSMLRHSSEAVTLRYIGITQDDIDRDFENLVL